MRKGLLFILLFAVAFTSCKKDKVSNTDDKGGTTTPTATIDLLKDSVYAYAKEEYLWYDALPEASVFNPRKFTGSTPIATLQAEIDALSQLKFNPSTNQPYEFDASYPGSSKYSYIDGGEAATSIGGTGGDFGFALTYIAANDLRIRYVYPNSSAASQNLARGYRVTAIDDQPITLTTGTSTDPAVIRINKSLSNSTVKLTVTKPDNTSATLNVSKTTYTINPVIKYSTFTTSTGKKVGYFAFNRFTVLTNAQAEIDKAFNKFMQDGVTELVVDLRYNGGGAVETSYYLANYMVPASKTGTVMFSESYNNKLQNDNYPLLAQKYRIEKGEFSLANNTYNFTKKGSLNLSQVFFLVTGNTASASELLINNLKPALPQGVKLIGETTYGKPVGFFGIPIGDKLQYDLYLAEFESRNADGKADFYQGMIPGSNFPGVTADDDLTKDFGDQTEGLLARAINYIDKGTYTSASYKSLSTKSTNDRLLLRNANQVIDTKQQFSGAVHTKDLKRIQ